MKVLILGGTGEARALASALSGAGHQPTTALAGRTSAIDALAGAVHIGAFGGAEGLSNYLKSEGFERLVDATHPYAAQISGNAVAAAELCGIALVRLVRPCWEPADGDAWVRVADIAEASHMLPANANVLLTTGHRGLEQFAERSDCSFTARLIEPSDVSPPEHMKVLLSRPPHAYESECALLQRLGATHLVTKNAGGRQTAQKLVAARDLGVEVVMIERPVLAAADEVEDVAAVLAWMGR
ncbi:precorrin-6A reductase [Devosia pacifica]|uniref:Precorrin-6A reductase n=1 Tax=Devosia pacifica TaxID=1335967 RepID=A0A918VUQ5_9HYPH|nr:cobalt-precorrin-6A reductase [Devosia pacifica]GHA30813.1 precorrin-6A reductase [Devosia pacifica]